jgi:hypothetical protein
MSPRTTLLRGNRLRQQNARLLELLYLACALLLGALLAATTLAAAPLPPAHARQYDEHKRQPQAMSRVVHVAPRTPVAGFDSK